MNIICHSVTSQLTTTCDSLCMTLSSDIPYTIIVLTCSAIQKILLKQNWPQFLLAVMAMCVRGDRYMNAMGPILILAAPRRHA